MGTSDRIEAFILELLSGDNDWIDLKRNELAGIFCCAPSQINYVLSTRFNEKNGYVTESRRGGGGYLRIKRISADTNAFMTQSVKLIGNSIDNASAAALVKSILNEGIIDKKTADIMLAAVSDKSIPVNQPHKNTVRAAILKNMLVRIEGGNDNV